VQRSGGSSVSHEVFSVAAEDPNTDRHNVCDLRPHSSFSCCRALVCLQVSESKLSSKRSQTWLCLVHVSLQGRVHPAGPRLSCSDETADDDQEALGTDLQTEQPQREQVRGSKSTSDIRTWVKEVLQEPAFPFKTSSLTQLGDIRARHSANNRTRIEVLACVTSKQNRRSPFERVREFILQDATNTPYTLKSRKEDYDAGHIRIGDIVSAGRK
jgi:hypothetical protein